VKAKDGVPAFVTPVQLFANATLYTIPLAWLAVLRVVVDGAVTTRPPGIVLGKPTARVEDPLRAVTGFTVTVIGAWPLIWVLQVRVLADSVNASLLAAWSAPEPMANAAKATDNL
jgi:hypothetical protein